MPQTDNKTDEEKFKAENHQLATKWLGEIDRQRSRERKWRERAREVIKRYRDDRDVVQEGMSRYNILYANTEVIKPAIFSRMPVPDVRRRWLTKNPAARTAALILERSLSYCMSMYDFRDVLNRALEDYVLPGRGQVFVRYEPLMLAKAMRTPVKPFPPGDPEETEKDDEGEIQDAVMGQDGNRYPPGTRFDAQGAYAMQQQEYKAWEQVSTIYVPWDLFGFSDCSQWSEVPAVWLGKYVRKDEIAELAPEFKDIEALNFNANGSTTSNTGYEQDANRQPDNTILVWRVYHKASRKYMLFAHGYEAGPLRVVDDPQQLENFYPLPEPLYAIRNNNDWCPKPEYTVYQDQAIEIDNLTNRQTNLRMALKYRGVYDQSFDNEAFKLGDLVRKPDNTFEPIPNFRDLAEKGGLENLLSALPLQEIVTVLKELGPEIDRLKQMIYEIYGIADIMRGASDAQETLGAQELKAQYGGLRVSTRQGRFQDFIRGILRIKAEIIAEHFSEDTLRLMCGIEVLPDAQFEQMKQQDSLPAGAVSETQFAEAIHIIRSDKLRGFIVDVETDSTVPVDRKLEQQNRIAFIQAVGQYLQGVIPAVQSGAIPAKVAREGLLFVVRGFKVGTELEDVLEELGDDGDQSQQLAQLQKMNEQLKQQLAQMQQELQDARTKKEENMIRAQADIAVSDRQASNDIAVDNAQAQNSMVLNQMKTAATIQQNANKPPPRMQ